jgi:hypothetical protein
MNWREAKKRAQLDWENATRDDPQASPGGGVQPWRRLGPVRAWLEWEGDDQSFTLQNISRDPASPLGSGKEMLDLIKSLCDRYGLVVKGMVAPQRSGQLPNASDGDFESLAQRYEELGFHIERAERSIQLRYPPPR